LPVPLCSSVFPILSCSTFKSYIKVFDPLWIDSSSSWKIGIESSTCSYLVFPETFVKETIFSPVYVLGSLVKNQIALAAQIYVWVFYSVPLVFVSVLGAVPCWFYWYGSVV
jgi:hypothetical protein